MLIERSDPSESFTYLQEQALRLSDKIEAMFRHQQNNTSKLNGEQPLQEQHDLQLLDEGPRRSPRTSTPVRSSSARSAEAGDMDVSIVNSSLDDCAFATPPNSSHATTRKDSSGVSLLKNFRIHIKSSASISGLRQLDHKRSLLQDSNCSLEQVESSRQTAVKSSSLGFDESPYYDTPVKHLP